MRGLRRERYLVRLCGLAGSRSEPAAASLCVVALGVVFASEHMNADFDIVASPPAGGVAVGRKLCAGLAIRLKYDRGE